MRIVNNIKFVSICILINIVILNSQNIDNGNFKHNLINKQVCRIYVEQTIEGQNYKFKGTGINIGKEINGEIIVFVITANHVIENLLKLKNSFLQLYFTNSDNNTLFTDKLSEDNIIWHDRKMDVAVIGIPKRINTNISNNTNWQIPTVKRFSNGIIGEDVYMLGKRWFTGKQSISIYKKGIISAITNDFPGYLGTTVYIIDKMSNKGMSGGLIYNDDFDGVAVISSYVLEKEKKIQTSDDLTVAISITLVNTKLDSVISQKGEEIYRILGY